MVSSQIVEIIIKVKDEMSKNLEKINKEIDKLGDTSQKVTSNSKNANNEVTKALTLQERAIQKVSRTYNKLKNTVKNVCNNIKTSITNSSKFDIKESNLAKPFMNAAEKIKQKWQTTMQHIKSEADKLANTKRTINIDMKTSTITDVTPTINKLKIKIGETINKCFDLRNTISTTFQNISKQGSIATRTFNSLSSSISRLTTPIATIRTSFINFGTTISTTVNNIRTSISQMFSNTIIGQKLSETATTFQNSFSNAITNVQNRFSMFGTSVGTVATNIRTRLSTAFSNINLFSNLTSSITGFQTRVGSAITSVASKFSSIQSKASQVFSSIRSIGGSAIDSLKSKIQSLSGAFDGLGGQIAQAVGVIGVGSFSQLTVGLSLSREKMSSLNTAIMGSKEASDSLLNSIDRMTNNSVVSMDQMVNAMNKIKLSTGLSNDQLDKCKGSVMKLGEAALLMGEDAELAGFHMSEAFSGLNGDFAVLKENFGITREKMIAMGWSGEASDVDGYAQALEKCVEQNGDLSAVMQTTSGKLSKIQKDFRTAGRSIGDALKPVIDALATAFIKLEEQFPGLAQGILVVAGLISSFVALAPTLAPIIQMYTSLKSIMSITNMITRLNTVATTLLGMANLVSGGSAEVNAVAQTTLSGALRATASSARALTMALLTNPFTWIAVAVIALIGVLVYLYKTNENVRNSINNLGNAIRGGLLQAWEVLKGVLTVVWNGLVQVGQIIYSELLPAWDQLNSMITPFIATLESVWKSITEVGKAFQGNGDSANEWTSIMQSLTVVWEAFKELLKIVIDIISVLAQTIGAILIPVLTMIIRVVGEVVKHILRIVDAFVKLCSGEISFSEFISKVMDSYNTLFSKLGAIIWQFISSVWSNLQSVWGDILAGLGEWIGSIIQSIHDRGAEIVNGIINWFVELPGNIYNCLESLLITIGEWFSSLITNLLTWGANILTSIAQWFVNLPGTLAEYLNQVLLYIGEWFSGLITNLFLWGSQILTGIANWLMMLPQQFMLYLQGLWTYLSTFALQLYTQFTTAAWNAVTGFISWICQLPGQVWNWLVQTISTVVGWIPGFTQKAITAGTGFLKGIIDRIRKIPGDIWTWLQNTSNKVKTWIPSFVQKAQESARKFVDKFKEKVKQLPQVMWDELMRIGDKIKNSVGDLVGKIKDLGRQMLDGFKNALGIHSPGYMYHAIAGEMGYLDKEILGNRMKLGTATKKLGASMIREFERNDYNEMANVYNKALSNMNTTTPTMETPTMETGGLNEMMQTQDAEMTQNNTLLQGLTIPSEQIMTDTQLVMNSVNTMVTTINPLISSVTGNLNTLSATSIQGAGILEQSNQRVIASYTQLNTMINQLLTNIINKNKSAWNSVKTTTQNQLKSMLNSTKSVTAQMVQAWNSMKNSIISAANQIKSQSEQRFNSLWNTIKRFYNRIRNPGGAGSPGTGGSRRGRTSNRSIGSVVRRSVKPLTHQQTTRRINPINLKPLLSSAEIEYMSKSGSKMIATNDILRYFNEKGKGAGWSDIVKPNVNWIRNKSNEWKVNGPKVFGKYSTGNDLFKVKEFENGTPTISYDTFRRMAENVFSQCHYEFYWDSERYGNWVAAAHNGGMNCSDSTDFLIALAHACGLPATKVHGHWNQFGHYWANVAGHKMDTTGWMKRRTWTPAQSHAGSPSKLELDSPTGTSDSIKHSGEITLNLNLDIQGADNLDKDTVTSIVQETLGSKDVLKQIARSSTFQEADANMKLKINKSRLRNG